MSVSINKKHILVLSVSSVLAVLLCAFRTYLLFNYIEPETGFYIIGTKLGSFFAAALVLALATCIAGCVFSKVRVQESLSSESTWVVFSSSLCGFLFATVLACGAYEFIKTPVKNAFFALELLLCIPCIIFFFSLCAKEHREKNAANIVLNLAPAVYYAIRTIHVFTDTTTQINTSQRSLSLVTLCSMMLMFVFETYFLLPSKSDSDGEKERKSVSFKYSALTLIVFTLSLSVSLPFIAASAFWVFESDFIVMDVLDLCIGIYAFTRAATLCRQ